MDIIQIEDLHFSYPEEEKEVLQGVNLRLEEGKFYILCGKSGCGKSTLLRHIKSVLAPKGKRRGKLWLGVKEEEIGFVFQHPDNQIVTDKVWHELVFGMENLGYAQNTMHLRVAELASYFGIESWFDKEVSQLSGGQKQILNLTAVLTLRPRVLLLDEPVAWLDPIAATEFLQTLSRIQKELGMTVLLSAHQMEEVISYGDELLLMEEGRITAQGNPEEIGRKLRNKGEDFYLEMPVPMRIYLESGSDRKCPYTIAGGREWLRQEMREKKREIQKQSCGGEQPESEMSKKERTQENSHLSPCILRVKNLWYRYPGSDADVLRGVSFQVRKGEILGILGGNGSGKSTLLKVMMGILSAGQGKTQILSGEKWVSSRQGVSGGEISLLPQDVSCVFLEERLEKDLTGKGVPEENCQWIDRFGLTSLLKRHPYDISGGERQKAAFVKLLLRGGKILLLDEPTKGMDAGDKKRFGETLQELAEEGAAIVMVSHDLEFTASYAHGAGIFFRGKLEGVMESKDFFARNHFYTTAAHRMSREMIPDAVTVEDVLEALEGKTYPKTDTETKTDIEIKTDTEIIGESQDKAHCGEQIKEITEEFPQPERDNHARGRILYLLGIFLLYPFLLWLGMTFFHDRRYLLISMGMVIYALLPFFCLWEKRPPKVQKLVVISVLAAIAVVGRCAFYMLPSVKPMAAIAIVAGISLGAESGFLVGALSMLVSNMMFGQGPWTPWQMLAMGLVGLLAGLLMHREGFFEKSAWAQRIFMTIYGMFSVLCIYGGIMNPASLLMAAYEVNLGNLVAIYLSGLPMDLIHGGTTAAILFVAGLPFLKKLERMKKKYELE